MDWSSAPELPKPFDLAERDRRWSAVREAMSQSGIDLLLVLPQWLPEDAIWLANEIAAVIFPLTDPPVLIKGGEGSNRAVTQEGWIEERYSATPRGSTRVNYGAAIAHRLRERGLETGRMAIAGLSGTDLILTRQPEGYVNYTTVAHIQRELPGLEIVDGTPIMSASRHVKSQAEIDLIRAGVKVAEASARVLREMARPGVRQAEVFGSMVLQQSVSGATGTMLSWCGGPWGEHKWRFTTPPPGVVKDSWYIGTEIGPELRGYNCQVSEPVVVGEPDPMALELFELGKIAFATTCDAMRAGSTWREVEKQVKSVAEGTPYDVELLVHGRGLGSEGPILIPVHDRGPEGDLPLLAGSTFIVKPYAYPLGPNYAHVTRSHDVTWGDTVVVADHGAERLGTRPHELFVIS